MSLTTTITHLRTVITHRLAHTPSLPPPFLHASRYRRANLRVHQVERHGLSGRNRHGWPDGHRPPNLPFPFLSPVGHYGLSVAENWFDQGEGECARFKFELLCLYVRIFGPVSIWPSFPPSSPLHILEIRATCNELRMGRMGKRGKCYPVRNKSTFILPGNKPGNAATCPAVQFSMRAKRGEHFSFLSFFFAYFNQFDRIELCANLKMNRVKI